MPDEFVGVPADQTGPQVAEAPGAHLAHLFGILAGTDEAHHLLNGQPGAARGRRQRRQLVELVGRQIPPIRMSANKFHHPRAASAQHQRYRMRASRGLRLAAPVVAPVPLDEFEVPRELGHPGLRILLADIESGEFGRPGSGAQAQLESALRRLGQRDRLFGQHRGMPERAAQHQVADPQPLGLGRHPGGDAHCLPDVFVPKSGRFQVIDEDDAVENHWPGAARPFRDVGGRQPDLGQEQIPLDHARHLKREIRCDCTRPASLLFLLC